MRLMAVSGGAVARGYHNGVGCCDDDDEDDDENGLRRMSFRSVPKLPRIVSVAEKKSWAQSSWKRCWQRTRTASAVSGEPIWNWVSCRMHD